MADKINGLGYTGVTNYNYTRQDEEAAKSAPEQKGNKQDEGVKQLGANEVLGFMAAVNADMVPQKAQRVVDVNKYVTPEQAERIAGFMESFEADYDEAKDLAINEFGVSEGAANEIALAYVNASY